MDIAKLKERIVEGEVELFPEMNLVPKEIVKFDYRLLARSDDRQKVFAEQFDKEVEAWNTRVEAAGEVAPLSGQEFLESVVEAKAGGYKLFLTRVVKWDLVDKETPVPLTVEGLMKHNVPFEVIEAINTKIEEGVRLPNPKTARK